MRARNLPARAVAVGSIALLAIGVLLPLGWPVGGLVPTVAAASCNGASHQVSLSAPDASPRSGTTTTSIHFFVTYRDTKGCPPSSVRVIVPGATQATMTAGSGSLAGGRMYSVSLRLPAGSWAYRFEATSGTGGGAKSATIVGPGSIVITVQPTPTPTPTPTPKPTPTPTPKPEPTSTPVPTPTPRSTPGPTAPPTSSPTPTPRSTPAPSPAATATSTAPPATGSAGTPSGSGGSKPPPGRTDGPEPSQNSDGSAGGAAVGRPVPSGPAGPGGATGTGGHGGETRSGGGPVTFPGTLFGVDPITSRPVLIWGLTTMFGVLLFALLLQASWTRIDAPTQLSVLVMDRRRGSGRSSPVVDVAGASGMADAGPAMIGPTGSFGDPARAGGRFVGVDRAPLRFSAPAAPTAERRTVAYRYVRVSAGPDDLRFPELARLDRRDEVEVIGSEAGYLQVRTPDGTVGWVPRFVLVGSPIRTDA